MFTKQKDIDDNRIAEIKGIMSEITKCTYDEFSSGMKMFGKDIIHAYAYGLLTDEQRLYLSGYKKWIKPKSEELLEKWMFNKFRELELFEEQVCVYQLGYVHDRIVIASTKSVMEGKDVKEKANGGERCIVEIYKSTSPKAYNYAKEKYKVFNAS